MTELHEISGYARRWLLEEAAPRWSTTGRTPAGLFAERMSRRGEPDPSYFRTFVQARHVYSFVIIGQLGWQGDWRGLVSQTVDLLLERARRADGFFVHMLDASGSPTDTRADLYDQAFIMFALGTAAKALERPDWIDAAETLLDSIEKGWTHPDGGFAEGEIVTAIPRRQNPHMHLLEAFLALSGIDGRERFAASARSIAELAATRLVDQSSGALLEYFTDQLQPAPGLQGQIVEPGHCFEWAWLFERIGNNGFRDGRAISDRLVHFARSFGIDSARGVAINEVLTDGTIHNSAARLWPQTERLKAAAIRYRLRGESAEAAEVAAAFAGLRQYWESELPGLWRDKLKADGNWVEEPAPGSSLYHISCAIAELSLASQPNPG